VFRHRDAPCGEGVDAALCPPITAINNSWGLVGGGAFAEDSAITKIQRKLAEVDVVTVWANGNDGDNGKNQSSVWGQDPTPGIISVANYDDGGTGSRDGALASSSSRGLKSDDATYPDISAPGTNITSACRVYLSVCMTGFETDDPDYNTISGTSMAAPFVAGSVAVVQQALEARFGSADAATVENTLVDSAHAFGADTYVPDSRNTDSATGTSYDRGHGLLDVANALNVVFDLDATDPPGDTGPDCSTGRLFTDREGDATRLAIVDGGQDANEPALDALWMTATADAHFGLVNFTIKMSDLGADATAPGESITVAFSDDRGNAHSMTAYRSPVTGVGSAQVNRPTFRVDGNSVTGSYDAAADTINFSVPRSEFKVAANTPALAGTVTFSGWTFDTRRNTGALLAPVADDGSGGCPAVLNLGGAPAEVPSPSSGTAAGNGGTSGQGGAATLPEPIRSIKIG
ncbi:MAG: S8 family serine peptidase, partial [Acidimicrobiales bacterium]